MRYLRAFGLFWWDFVVGDDWRAALGLVVAIGATAALVAAGIDAWWLMPVAVVVVLVLKVSGKLKASAFEEGNKIENLLFGQDIGRHTAGVAGAHNQNIVFFRWHRFKSFCGTRRDRSDSGTNRRRQSHATPLRRSGIPA